MMKKTIMWLKRLFLGGLVLASVYVGWTLLRPVPALQPVTSSQLTFVKTESTPLIWPASQAAVGVLNSNVLEVNNDASPQATASTAKILTSLMVLEKKPLKAGEQGPLITISAQDVENYKNYVSQDGSVLPVKAGDQLTQYQALQAVMLPSANNIADTLAVWAYGSIENYIRVTNEFLASKGIKNTKVGGDASGLSPLSKATAEDLVKIGLLAMQNPVLAEIAAQPTASGLPGNPLIKNVNVLLGTDGIIGIKTGNSDHVGGAFVAAAQTKPNDPIIVSAVTGAPSLVEAMRSSLPLLKSAQNNIKTTVVINPGQKVGEYIVPWGKNIPALTTGKMTVLNWGGQAIGVETKLAPINKDEYGNKAGSVQARNFNSQKAQYVDVELASTPPAPSIKWRLTHPFDF